MNGELAPYRGLTPFGDSETDALFFFGRDRERELIVANLMASRLTVLYGETGVGKSSVLRAGVARHLRELTATAVVVFGSWQEDPAGRLEREIAETGGVEATGSLADTIERCTARLDGELYVILDQVEEYFLYQVGEDGPGTLALELPEALRRSGLRASFLVSLREDAVARLDRFKGRIPNLFGNYLRLDHLDREAARRAILGPLERYGELAGPDERVGIESTLVEAVLEEVAAGRVGVGQSGRGAVGGMNGDGRVETPYLQLVMQRLWDAECELGSRELRLSTLRELGGAEQIVRDHLEHALEELSPEQQDLAAEMFDHLVTPSGMKIAHAPSDLARYAHVDEAELLPALQALTEARIVRPTADEAGTPRYEIYHDVLADAVLGWRAGHDAGRELERERLAAARRHRRLLSVIGVAAVLLAAMAGLTIFAFTQRSDARSQARKAHARELDATALSVLTTNPRQSLADAVEAARLQGTLQSEDVLRRSLLASRLRGVLHAGGPVTSALYASDGNRIVTSSLDGKARIYDARSQRRLETLDHGAPIGAAAVSGDDRLVFTGGDDGSVREWAAANGRPLRTFHAGGAIRSVAADRVGSLVAAAEGRAARLWRARTGDLLATVRMAKPVTEVRFSPDGRLLAVTGNADQAVLVDTSNGRLVQRLDQGDRITNAAFGPGGRLLATAGADGTVRAWNVRTGKPVRALKADAGEVLGVAFSPRGTLLATAHSNGTGRVWNLATGGVVSTLVGHTNPVTGVAFSPDGFFVVTASPDRTARVWKADNGDQRAVLVGHREAVVAASFSPDGKRVLTGSADGTARTWDPITRPRLRLVAREAGPVVGALFVNGQSTVLVVGPGRTVRLVRGSDGTTTRIFRAPGRVTTAVAGGGGKLVAIGAGRGVTVFDSESGSKVGSLTQPAGVTGVAFSPDASKLVTAGADGVGRVWTTEGHLLRDLRGHERALTDVAYSPDEERVATGSKDGTARIWDAGTGAALLTLRGHTDAVTSVAFSPDGLLVLTASVDHDARLWNTETGAPVQVLRFAFGRVADANFSPDGRWIVTANPASAQLWQPGVADPLFPFGLGGHAKPLTSAVFGPDSRTVLTAGEDGTVRRYRCDICGGIDELLPLAERRLRADS